MYIYIYRVKGSPQAPLRLERLSRHGDPRRHLCGSPPVASAPRRRARETAPG